ncbi:hypothetical protein Tco_0408630 [Tanacetum coccineum]
MVISSPCLPDNKKLVRVQCKRSLVPTSKFVNGLTVYQKLYGNTRHHSVATKALATYSRANATHRQVHEQTLMEKTIKSVDAGSFAKNYKDNLVGFCCGAVCREG